MPSALRIKELRDLNDNVIMSDGALTGNVSLANIGDNSISGDKIHGGTISNFSSTGITDNGDSTSLTIQPNRIFEKQNPHNSSDRHVEGWFNTYISTSYVTIFTVDIGNPHQGIHYELFTWGGDWGSHSSARVAKSGFINGYDGYTGHSQYLNGGPYAANILSTVVWSGNSPSLQLKLDSGSVTIRGYVKITGHFSTYSIVGNS